MSNCCGHEIEEHGRDVKEKKKEKVLSIIGILIFVIGILLDKVWQLPISFWCYLISYFFIGYEIIGNALKHLFKKDMFDENFLMTIATIGAFCIGEHIEGIAVLLFYKVGEFLQDKAVDSSKKKIESVLDIREEIANLKQGEEIIQVNPKDVAIDSIIVVKTGEKVPLDGIVYKGETQIDMSLLNGESKPRKVAIGEEILSGSINLGGVIQIQVKKAFEDSTVSKIIDLIQNAIEKKSDTEKFITRFAKIYTPIVTLIAVCIAIFFPILLQIPFSEALSRAFIFLVISCPCALVVSVPLGFFVGIGACSKKGILIKGSNFLDLLNEVDTVVFDKTGTLTKGVFEVVQIQEVESVCTKEELLEYAAICESFSNHYIAKSIVSSYGKNINQSKVSKHEEIAGFGIQALIQDKKILCGNEKLLEKYHIDFTKQESIGTVVYLAIEEKFAGYLVLCDEVKESTRGLVEKLKKQGIKKVVMLTGDNRNIAQEIAKKIGLDQVFAELLPENKATQLEIIKKEAKKVAYIGDGINDGPVIALADVGISMGKGSDVAIETSDIVLMTDEPSKLVDGLQVAKKTRRIVTQNIVFAIAIKILFLLTSSLGLVNMWWAIFADVGVALLAILNAMRIFKVST